VVSPARVCCLCCCCVATARLRRHTRPPPPPPPPPPTHTHTHSERNLLGLNQKLSALVELGQADSLFRLQWVDPWIMGDPKRTSRTLSIMNTRRGRAAGGVAGCVCSVLSARCRTSGCVGCAASCPDAPTPHAHRVRTRHAETSAGRQLPQSTAPQLTTSRLLRPQQATAPAARLPLA
jgi:hypothetical protein